MIALWLAGAVLLLFALPYLAFRVRGRRATEREEVVKEQRRELDAAVRAGTHDRHGHPICCIPGCNAVAELHPLSVTREEGFAAWIRAHLFGAPARYHVERNPWKPPKWCRGHGELALAELRAFLIGFELARLKAQCDAELELSRFETIGLDERVTALVAAHEGRSAARAP